MAPVQPLQGTFDMVVGHAGIGGVSEWSSRGESETGKNDLKSSSSLPLHAQGRRRTVPFKTTLFQCFVFFFCFF